VVPELLTALASIYIRRGDVQVAADLLRRAIALDPEAAEAHLKLAQAYRLQKRYPAALHELRAAAPQSGRVLNTLYALQLEADVHYETGRVYEEQRDAGRASEAYERALVLDPQHRSARDRLRMLREE
jgi:Tfp pilus assembly protein PilF